MYDRSQAALHRVAARVDEAEDLGPLCAALAARIAKLPDSPLRDSSLKKLADSLDDAACLIARGEKSSRNSLWHRNRNGLTGR